MMLNRKKERVPDFQYPRVYVETHNGMPVYSFKTPMAGRGSTIIQLLIAVGAMYVFGWAMDNEQGWLNEGWQGGFVLGSFGLATFAAMKAIKPKRARIVIDSRDLTLRFDGKRHDLTAFEAFEVDAHPASKNPKRTNLRNWMCVFGRYGPMGGHKMTLAELKDGDERGEAGLIRAALDWCGRRAWEAHEQAKRTKVAVEVSAPKAPLKTTQTPVKNEDDWPLDG